MSQKSPYSGKAKNRYFPRMALEVLLAYRPESAPKTHARVVKSRTLGLGGIMFESEHPLPVGSVYLLDLLLGEKRLEVPARVVYSNSAGPDLYENGLSFDSLSDGQREALTNFFLQEYEKAPRE